nr:zinc finger protein 658B-like [Crassostrea gigas]
MRMEVDTGKEQSEGKEESQRATQLYAILTQDSEDEFAVQPGPVVRSSSLQCPDCPKSFKRKNELKVHIKARHEKAAFSCSKCQKTFAYKTNAKRHEAKCNGADQHSELSSEQKSTAEKREKSTEERGKGIKCKKCGHVSANKRELGAHRKFHAEEEKPQREKSTGPTCRICSKEFPNRMALYIHQNVDHQTGSGEVGDFPWEPTGEPAPWDGDERLKSAYMANKKFILS